MMQKMFRKMCSFGVGMVLSLVIVASPLCVQAKELPNGQDTTEISTEFDTLLEEHKEAVVGGNVILSVDGEQIYAKDFGYANVEASTLITKDTVFEWGSASKLLIWISVLQLKEAGDLDMQTEVAVYLPEGSLKDKLTGSGITMEHLINYTSGMQDSVSEKFVPEGSAYAELEAALLTNMPRQAYGAGSVHAVTDWPCALAAYVVECVSGVGYDTYVKENIFTPLGMEHTALLPDLSDNEWVSAARKEVNSYQNGGVLVQNSFYHIPLYPAAMVTGTAEDFHLFASELLVQNESSKLFKEAETAETLFDTTLCYMDSEEARVANGMLVYRMGKEVYGMNGNSATQTCIVYLEPESKTCFTYMSNQYREAVLSAALVKAVFGTTELEKQSELSGLRVYEGVYVPGNAMVEGKLSFQAVLSAVFVTLDENQNLVMPTFGNQTMFEIMDEEHFALGDGSIGNLYSHADGTTILMLPGQDYVSYSAFEYWSQVILFFAMLTGYFYSSLVVICAVFAWIMRRISKDKTKLDKFRKYHYIQCLNVTLYSIFFAVMALMSISYAPVSSIEATAMMYWLGSILSIVYLVFFWKTGRKEETEKKNMVFYWITAVFAVITLLFGFMYGLIV